MNWKGNRHGQALIEVAMFFMLLATLLAGLCGFTHWIAIRQKLLVAAKEGAILYSSGHLEVAEVKRRVIQFLTSGTPALQARDLKISIGRYPGFSGWTYKLDQIVIRYRRPGGWYRLLVADPTLEEKCVIEHAQHYGPRFQTFYGPPVPW